MKQTRVGLGFQINHRASRGSAEIFGSMPTNETKLMTKHTGGRTAQCAERGPVFH